MKRTIEFTDAAISLIAWEKITRGEFTQLLAMLKEVAALPHPNAHYAVTAIKCTGDDGWMRMKHAPTGTRVAFEYDDESLTVHAVLRRAENTYRWLEIWYQADTATAA